MQKSVKPFKKWKINRVTRTAENSVTKYEDINAWYWHVSVASSDVLRELLSQFILGIGRVLYQTILV